MKKILEYLALAVIIAMPAGCKKENTIKKSTAEGTDWASVEPAEWVKDGLLDSRGKVDTLDFTYDFIKGKDVPQGPCEALKDRPVHVVYFIPNLSGVEDMPILFVMHGAERVGTAQYNAWRPFAQKYGFILVIPQFLTKQENLDILPSWRKPMYAGQYWLTNDYQFGSVSTASNSGKLRPRDKWAYNVIELLFEYFRHELDNTSKGYYIYGHSAGGQFVNRMVMAYPEARIIKACAANPSSWAWPSVDGVIKNLDSQEICNEYRNGTKTYTSGWGYSIKELYKNEADLAKPFKTKLYVQIGTKDLETESLDQQTAANAQGARRYFRALNFYATCMEVAERAGIKCNYELAEVEGASHSTYHMAYGKPNYSTSKVSFDQLGPNAAFTLLFKGVLTERSK